MADLRFLAGDWPTVSRRLDEALAIAPAQRPAWLAGLPETEAIKATLRRLLAEPAAVETDDLLVTLPRITLAPAAPPVGDAADAAEAATAGQLIGPYRLIHELGSGGMGMVWLAERIDGSLKRRVALKLPRLGWTRGLAARMSRERDILASLDHPNIARIYDAGLDAQGRPYLALEYVEGQAIDLYCQRLALTIPQRLQLILQVAHAVAHAHARLVVHRDLKPANILVTAAGEVRLLDFGIAKLMEGELTRDTQLTQQAGRPLTLAYASPEQIRGEPIGTASDVYSLGVVAYELLAGDKPYLLKRDSAAALEEAIVTADQRLASTASGDPVARKALKGDLDAILNKALKRPVAERYPTVDALAQDIERHLAQQPVLARPDAAGYRLRKFLLRNQRPVAAAAAAVAALLAGSALALWQATLAREQARIATAQTALATSESRRAQAVQGFLLDIFRTNSDQQADPLKARNTTARELLDIGSARLAQSLRDAPEARAEVMETLGEMYYQLQLDEQAVAIEGQRIALLKQLHGARDRRVAEALINYAASLHATSQREQILPALQEAQAILDASGDRSSRLRGELLTRLAQRHQNLSYEKMKAYADEALQVLRPHAVAGEDRLSTALHLAARARVQLGEPAEAEALYRESMRELAKTTPMPQVALVQARTALGECLAAQQKFDEALKTYRDAAAAAAASLGPSDPGTIVATSRLAALLHATGQRREAGVLHQDALRRVLEVKGADDTLFTPIVRMDLGRSLLAEGRLQEALDQVAAVNASNRRHYPGSAVLGNGLRVEATILTAMGRHAPARALFAEGLALWQQGAGSSMPAWRNNRFHLDEAGLDLARGDAASALARLDLVAAPANAERLPLRAEEIERDLLRAQAHMQLGAADSALALARGAADRLAASSVHARHPALEAQAQLTLGLALLRAGQPTAALPPIERALAWRTNNDDADSPAIAEAQAARGQALRALRDPAMSRR